jgi:chromosome partitioning protein
MRKIQPLPPEVSIETLNSISEKAADVIDRVRDAMLSPDSIKKPPRFNSQQLADICGLDLSQVQYQAKKGDLPSGEQADSKRRSWTLKEARQWVRKIKAKNLRDPVTTSAVTLCVAHFKGGVGKSSMVASLAQGLSLRAGAKVLIVDCDPQASLTTLFIPERELEQEKTVLPLYAGEVDHLNETIQETYWDGIDIIGASPALFSAEFILPTRQIRNPEFEFWRVLDEGLEPLRSIYDVIIIDTPPSLSFLTLNALFAANGVLMPLPPNNLDFNSSILFWQLFTETCEKFAKLRGDAKRFHFIDVVPSKVDRADSISVAVQGWIDQAYAPRVVPHPIPKTSIAATASASFGSVYDMDATTSQAKTLARARDAWDQLTDYVDNQIAGIWEYQDHLYKATEIKISEANAQIAAKRAAKVQGAE